MDFDLTGNHAYNVDCIKLMRQVPDKYFDLSVVDPPYGGGADEKPNNSSGGGQLKGGLGEYNGAVVGRFGGRFEKYHLGEEIAVERTGGRTARYLPGGSNIDPDKQIAPDIRNSRGRFKRYADIKETAALESGEITAERDGRGWAKKYSYDIRSWDIAPTQEYFDELARISNGIIIWGGNYFDLPPTRCFLVWRKLSISETFTMAMAEYAWTNFNDNAKVFDFAPQGKKDDPRFHPTSKPIELYSWIYGLYAKPGYKIFDSHLGSGSSRIAAYNAGLDFIGCEIDPVYFEKEEERFAAYAAQQSLFRD